MGLSARASSDAVFTNAQTHSPDIPFLKVDGAPTDPTASPRPLFPAAMLISRSSLANMKSSNAIARKVYTLVGAPHDPECIDALEDEEERPGRPTESRDDGRGGLSAPACIVHGSDGNDGGRGDRGMRGRFGIKSRMESPSRQEGDRKRAIRKDPLRGREREREGVTWSPLHLGRTHWSPQCPRRRAWHP